MNLWNSIVLGFSGGLVASSIILAYIGLSRSALSRRMASLIGGVGSGVGVAMFVFDGVSNRDLLGSAITGMIVAVTVGLIILTPNRWWRQP